MKRIANPCHIISHVISTFATTNVYGSGKTNFRRYFRIAGNHPAKIEEMKTVGTHFSIENAERARLELLSIGIEANIENEFSATTAPHLMLGSSGSVRLLVEESEFEEASKILKEFKEANQDKVDSPPFARYRKEKRLPSDHYPVTAVLSF